MVTKDKYFETTDADLTAFLLTVGFQISNTVRIEGRFTLFQFPNTPEIEDAARQFLNDTATAKARSLLENLRRVRIMHHQLSREVR